MSWLGLYFVGCALPLVVALIAISIGRALGAKWALSLGVPLASFEADPEFDVDAPPDGLVIEPKDGFSLIFESRPLPRWATGVLGIASSEGSRTVVRFRSAGHTTFTWSAWGYLAVVMSSMGLFPGAGEPDWATTLAFVVVLCALIALAYPRAKARSAEWAAALGLTPSGASRSVNEPGSSFTM